MTDVKVRATQPGVYKQLRKEGDTFNIPENLFSETWMEKAEPKSKPGPKPKEDKGGESKEKPKED